MHSYWIPPTLNEQSNACPHTQHPWLVQCSPDQEQCGPIPVLAYTSFTACLFKHTQPIHHHCLQYTCSTTDGTYLPLRNWITDLWSSLDWLPSGMASVSCTVMLSLLAIHPVNCTALHKCLPVCLPSHMCSCAIKTATSVLWMGFSYTCLIQLMHSVPAQYVT